MNRCDFHDYPAWKALRVAWSRYCADPSKENQREYFKVAVPRWQREKEAKDG